MFVENEMKDAVVFSVLTKITLQGQCLFDQGLFAQALECFVRAADLKPTAKGYHLRAITCLAALGRHQECLALITRLDAESTGIPELYVLRARLHQQFGNVSCLGSSGFFKYSHTITSTKMSKFLSFL